MFVKFLNSLLLNEFVLLSPSTPACALPLFSFDVTKILLLKYNLCLIRTYSAFCRLISQLFFVSLQYDTNNLIYNVQWLKLTDVQSLRSSIFPHFCRSRLGRNWSRGWCSIRPFVVWPTSLGARSRRLRFS